MTRNRNANKVLLILRTNGSGRELLQGALQYARTDPYCSVTIDNMPDMLTPEKVRALGRQGLSGILTSEIGMTQEVTDEFARLDVPMIVMSAPDPRLSSRKSNIAFVGMDEEGIGALGAKYLISLGAVNSYGFVASYRGLPWSDLRKRGFTDTIRAAGHAARTMDGPENLSIAPGSPGDIAKLENWLLDLPKPAAVMTDHDARAAQVLECCARLGLKVPQQVSVLGVDNDRVICDFTVPTLSSVLPDHEQVGYRAAEQLASMMAVRENKIAKTKVVRCPPKTVVVRESSRPFTPSARLIHQALAFIDQRACEGIRVTDVVKHLGVSRALADLRFRQVENKSILEAILDRRLAEVTRLLLCTNDSITRISLLCGFRNPKHLKRLFKQRTGTTMRDFRNSRGAAAARMAMRPFQTPSNLRKETIAEKYPSAASTGDKEPK